MTAPLSILLADDEPTIRLSVGDALAAEGHQVLTLPDGQAAYEALQQMPYDLLLSDIRMPKLDGMTLFGRARAIRPDMDVVLMTAYGSIKDAVTALSAGAADYLTKPFELDELLARVRRIAEQRALREALVAARRELASAKGIDGIVGSSPAIVRLRERIATLADAEANVLVQGESGTGKELVARSLHHLSRRTNKRFVAVNCAAFPESLLEAELFGHERGAFTGAVRKREGRFLLADGGTLFLDEVAEMPLLAQAKLLRVLQEGTFEPLGCSRSQRVDVRVIAATHRDLKQRVASGTFREDLYFRLRVLDLSIPPLRERGDDLHLLVAHFLGKFGRPDTSIAPTVWGVIASYPFPGNVRELEHTIQHAVVLSRGAEIRLEHLPTDLIGSATLPLDPGDRPLAVALRDFERHYIQNALVKASGVRQKAAEILGISRKNLWEKLKALELSSADDEPPSHP